MPAFNRQSGCSSAAMFAGVAVVLFFAVTARADDDPNKKQITSIKYFTAMQMNGLTRDEASRTDYPHDPKATVKNTKMAFAGLKADHGIERLIAGPDWFDGKGKHQKCRRSPLMRDRRTS